MSVLFTPCLAGSVNISATSVSANTALFTADKGNVLKISNQGTGTIFFRVGTASQTATITDMAVLSGEVVYIPVDSAVANIGVKAVASGTATVRACKGYVSNTR